MRFASHASLLINKEKNILLVAKRLGHADISRTFNTYSHLTRTTKETLMDAIEMKLWLHFDYKKYRVEKMTGEKSGSQS